MPDDLLIPKDAPESVRARALEPRVPVFDPTVGIEVDRVRDRDVPPHRLVAIGDSLTHGFQSGAVHNTDLSWPSIVAHELGWTGLRVPRYEGMGGLPLNMELLLRELEHRYGSRLSPWEFPLALFRARQLMDQVEDYWERGPGATPPDLTGSMHALAVYGWDLRDALSRTAKSCQADIQAPSDGWLKQIVENHADRAALRVYPTGKAQAGSTLFDVAEALGEEHDTSTEAGIETLVVFLGANNALGAVTTLDVRWSGPDYAHPKKKRAYNVWRPEHFEAELAEVVERVKRIKARHVIWCTVPHVTIAPIARGVGGKLRAGSRYYPYYTRPWVDAARFDPAHDPFITGAEARAVDAAIDCYNDELERVVTEARGGQGGDGETPRDWYLLDVCGLLDRLASRRYISDPNARPEWWTPYPLPSSLATLDPVPDSRFLTSDGEGGRATGGIFSLDGVHPTTVGYGIVAQEVIGVMQRAGVRFADRRGRERTGPVTVDMDRLVMRDTLLRNPPQNLTPGLELMGWADETLDWVARTLRFAL
ncbi:hypothetical protein [Aquipuribacter sp. MA13-6]|uniref:hypothetical protein n=1 Tax=unclassified Aquipuribacter TaxID=2635084 RepID=UPI003EEA46FC